MYSIHNCSDLVIEAEILSSLSHPNIIKIRGINRSGADGFADGPTGYFLVIDRFFGTLDQRMRRWRDPKHAKPASLRSKSFLGKSFPFARVESNRTERVHHKLTKEEMDERLDIGTHF